jgi:hypothetical protein
LRMVKFCFKVDKLGIFTIMSTRGAGLV